MIPFTKIFLSVGLLGLFCGAAVADEIYLVIGQSNASGRGTLPSRLSNQDGVYVFTGDEFVPAQENVNIYSSVGQAASRIGYSFAYSFGEVMSEGIKDDVLLVSNARGGTGIRLWLPGTSLYNAAVDRVKDAIRLSGSKLTGVVWHQGESDRNNNGYAGDLQDLIDGLRSEFNDDSLPFVAGEISYARGESSARVNDRLHDVEGLVDYYAVASADGLNAPDELHFDTDSLDTLGKRYAALMLNLRSLGAGQGGFTVGKEYTLRSRANQYLAGDGSLADTAEVWTTPNDNNKDEVTWIIDSHPTNNYYQIKLAVGGTESMLYIKERDGSYNLELTKDRFVGPDKYWKIERASGGSGAYHITAVDFANQSRSRVAIGTQGQARANPSSSVGTWATIFITEV